MNLRTTASNLASFPGMGDLPGDDRHPNSPSYDSSRDDAIDELVTEWLDDEARCREADDWNDGTQDCEHYSAVERALADFGGWDRAQVFGAERPATLNDVIDRLHQFAQVHARARRARLEEMAAEEIDGAARKAA